MVLGGSYIPWNKNFFFLKHFFQLWKWWISSGGRAHGKKVFWGQVAHNKNYFYLLNHYSVWNTWGIIQFIFKKLNMNFTVGFIFYPAFGLFTINFLEQYHEVTSFIFHDTTTSHSYFWGNSVVLQNANIGTVTCAVQSWFQKKIIFAWSCGTYTKIIKKSFEKIFIQLPSTLIYSISSYSSGMLGLSSKKILWKLTKAGQSRYINWTPKVWGIAMNPVDHPHGGWTNKGCHPVTPSGWLTKGVKTRKNNIWSNNKIYAPWVKHL